jgi:hypothetical protein
MDDFQQWYKPVILEQKVLVATFSFKKHHDSDVPKYISSSRSH